MAEYKIVVVGSGGAGKSRLTLQFVQSTSYDPTIEDSYRKQRMIDDQVAMLDILDLCEVEFPTLREMYIRNGQGFVLVYSVTSNSSFDEISQFKEEICRIKATDLVPMILVGCKSDLEDQREVPADEAAALANCWNIPFLEASAKRHVNVDEVFFNLVRQIRTERNLLIPTNKKSGGNSLIKCSIL